jgi:hypothetical protein
MDFVKELLNNWRTRNDRVKLQHAYLAIAFISIVVSGIVGLLNSSVGRKLAYISLAAIVIYLVNAVIWALVNSSVVMTGESQTETIRKNSGATVTRKSK